MTHGSEARSPGAHAGPGGVSAPLLEVRDLEARYGAVLAVRGLSLRVGEGEIVALLGANGAGKTTTLSCIAGLHRSRTGSIVLAGEDVGKLAPERIVRRGVALTPEGRRLFASLTVAENLEIGAAAGADGTRRSGASGCSTSSRSCASACGRRQARSRAASSSSSRSRAR